MKVFKVFRVLSDGELVSTYHGSLPEGWSMSYRAGLQSRPDKGKVFAFDNEWTAKEFAKKHCLRLSFGDMVVYECEAEDVASQELVAFSWTRRGFARFWSRSRQDLDASSAPAGSVGCTSIIPKRQVSYFSKSTYTDILAGGDLIGINKG